MPHQHRCAGEASRAQAGRRGAETGGDSPEAATVIWIPVTASYVTFMIQGRIQRQTT